MNHSILIEQINPSEGQIITESAQGKDCFLSGVFMQADMQNRNGRNYPLSEISKAVVGAQSYIKEHNGIFGELDHPQTLNINLDRISHVITDIRMEGSNAVGKAKILTTPMGQLARTLIESGARIGVSSRGAGQVNGEGVVEGFNFVTVDLVATPSAPGAMPNTIYESLMMDQHGKEALSLAESMKHDPIAQEYFKKEIMKFLASGIFQKNG